MSSSNELDDLFTKLSSNQNAHKPLLQVHLSKELLEKYRNLKTARGGNMVDCIRSGCLHLDSLVGLYAPEPEAYDLYRELFDLVIKDYHLLPQNEEISHPASDFGDLDNFEFEDLDPEGQLIISSRVRVGRAIAEYGFPPVFSLQDIKELEAKAVDALNSLEGELKGTYYPLNDMSDERKKQLTQDHFLFRDDSKFRKCIGGYNHFPDGRGIFFNNDKNFLSWVNEGDHLRLISMQPGGNLGAVYKRLVNGIKSMEKKLTFARHERLGYLGFCPTNLGTAMRASVHIKIPHLSARQDLLQGVCDKYKLQTRGIHGEHTESEGGVYDVSNKRRLGITEIQAVTEMATGVKEIIRLEKELASGKVN